MSIHHIVAPHADDEIIGCWEILQRSDKETVLVHHSPDAEPSVVERQSFHKRWPEVKTGLTVTPLGLYQYLEQKTYGDEGEIWYIPDPMFENHPEHRRFGGAGMAIALGSREHAKVRQIVFYTTNMMAPYSHEVEDSQGKHDALEIIYPLKSSLWRYDHRYYLFEGRCQWL